MENKYSDLIISLIKEHPKYPGYEAILEELFEDVVSRSKVVLGTVPNEEVIISYLKKVISSSIVTVPKKLNFNTRVRHRAISTLPASIVSKMETKVEPVPVLQESVVLVSNVEEKVLVEENRPIEEPSILTFVEEDVVLTEDALGKEDILVAELGNEESAKGSLEEELVVEEDIEPLKLESENLIEDSIEEVLVEDQQIINVDKTLVDKMINGVVSSPKLEEVETLLPEIDIVDEISKDITIEDATVEEESYELESEELVEEPAVEELELSAEEESFELESEELVEESAVEELELVAKEESFELESEELVEESAVEELELAAKEESFELESEELVEEPAIEELELSVEEDSLELVAEDLIEEPAQEAKELVETVISYDCFSFEPEDVQIDADLILDELKVVANKYPQKKIFEVCDLKYKKCLSVKEISEKLGFTQDNVVDILNDIIDIVKD